MRLSFKTQFKIEFFTTVYRWKKCSKFPLAKAFTDSAMG